MSDIYESAVEGRRTFRAMYREEREKCRRYRDALDRIARFDEAFADTIKTEKHGNLVGAALAQTLANYARRTLASSDEPATNDSHFGGG